METRQKHSLLDHPILTAIVLPVTSILGISLLTSILSSFFADAALAEINVSSVIQSVLRIFLAFLIIAVMKRGGKFRFGFSKKKLLLSFALASAGFLIAVYNIVQGILLQSPLQATAGGILSALLGGIAPGFFEEIVCRGIVLSNMMVRWRTRSNFILRSVLASGIIFGLIHLLNAIDAGIGMTIIQIGYAAGIGIFFGAVYVRTRNLWGPVFIHAAADISTYLFIRDTSAVSEAADWISGAIIAIGYTLVGLCLIRPCKHREISALWND